MTLIRRGLSDYAVMGTTAAQQAAQQAAARQAARGSAPAQQSRGTAQPQNMTWAAAASSLGANGLLDEWRGLARQGVAGADAILTMFFQFVNGNIQAAIPLAAALTSAMTGNTAASSGGNNSVAARTVNVFGQLLMGLAQGGVQLPPGVTTAQAQAVVSALHGLAGDISLNPVVMLQNLLWTRAPGGGPGSGDRPTTAGYVVGGVAVVGVGLWLKKRKKKR